MVISKLKPGMTVYDVHSHKMGNTTLSSIGVWPIEIVSVDIDAGKVVARWNYNPPETFWKGRWSKWRLKKPVLIDTAFGGKRLANRGEAQ